ncbi:ABC transporter substrate-binding protein [Paenibacillus mendelii]|uniref:ABC transporter substrate-binding protein n=1 Tax=Paenibacillus mendelii TaxID=206163 RepID=A0ABV6JF74_9BACL|nr:extracellular solute-binding protein [Paenibacillus mendelii]MCQ6557081.1 extracellular solute-binding protein [Paenibacillus mendelii]
MKLKGIVTIMAFVLLLTACSGNNAALPAADGSGIPDTPSDGKKTVVVAVQGSNKFLEDAAKRFEEAHSDIDIEIKSYMALPEADGNGMTAAISLTDIEKYVQTVTTQIMAGKGSDLIVMQNLPQSKFVEKNILVNLYDLMDKDSAFNKSDYYANILRTAQDGEGLYAMPFSVILEVIQGRIDLLEKGKIEIDDDTWTWEQFKAIAKKLKEQEGPDYYAFINLFPVNLLSSYIEDNYTELVQPHGKANFDSDAFREMMRQIKSMYDEHVLQAEFTYDYDKALFSLGSFTSPEEALRLMTMPRNKIFKSPTAKGESKGIPYRSSMNLGMNSKSKVQQEAWEFMKFLLSEEMQRSPELLGFPVNKNVTVKRIEEAAAKLAKGDSEYAPFVPDSTTIQAKAAEIKEMMEKAGVKLDMDFKVMTIAMAEFDTYMSGQKQAEEVSKLIQNRVMTYLNE